MVIKMNDIVMNTNDFTTIPNDLMLKDRIRPRA